MKIKKIEVKNFKAVSEQTADFDGHSAIVVGGNDKGKSSLLKGIIDRFRGEKPDIILKEGESKGYNVMELTDGSKVEWKFTEKSESFAYITPEGVRQTTGVLKAIGEKYFGIRFDIDEFLNSQPKQQVKKLQQLVGLDFSEIDEQYKQAFEERRDAKKELDMIVKDKKEKPEPVEKPNIEAIKKELDQVKEKNQKLYEDWKQRNEEKRKEVEEFNKKQSKKTEIIDARKKDLETIKNTLKGSDFQDCFDFQKAQEKINQLPQSEKEKEFSSEPEPEYYSTTDLEEKLQTAYEQKARAESYEEKLKEYNQWVKKGKAARSRVEQAEKKVKDIEKERQEMINNANIPEEFEFTDEGVKYQGFPLQSNQVSSSGKYIAALKLGSMVMGDVKAMYFDASFLDKNSLAKVQEWADKNDYQLLIERPDFEGGEIRYEIV
jgi:DNA repair exonuclease SbcCD ATPase subunit